MGLIPSPVQRVKGSGTAAALAWIQYLAQELPYAVGMAKKKKEREREKERGRKEARKEEKKERVFSTLQEGVVIESVPGTV